MENTNGISILYGSETGNAHDYAQYLSRRLRYFLIEPTLASMDDFPLKNLITSTKYLIVICSTTGQGELPHNSKKFMKFLLKKKLPQDLLGHIKITSFGIGDSSYPKFNYAIKKIHARLMQLGCQELSARCEADELSPEGIDGYYKEWEGKVIAALQLHIPTVVEVDDSILLPPENPIIISENASDIDTILQHKALVLSRNQDGMKVGKIKLNKRITLIDHFQDVRHILIESNDLDYSPGDTVALYPCNDDTSVEILMRLQPHWIPYADKPLEIGNTVPSIPGGFIEKLNLTLRSLFKYHLDIQSIPRRSFFMLLWHFCDSSSEDGAREQEKLKEFSSIEESEELYNYANRPRRLILETVLEFQQNLKIPIEYVFDLFPTIKPRLFLIASKPSQNFIEIVVAIVEYKTIIRRIRRGLCSKWLKLLKEGDQITISVHGSGLRFQLSDTPPPPIIMVAPGTGVAPMKSLIEDISLKHSGQELHLFYGCRYKDKDFLFSDRWQQLSKSESFHIYPCFSRDLSSGPKYVQHELFNKKMLIGDLILNKNAIVFVCGSSGSMPREVRITLVEILSSFRNMPTQDADGYLLSMEGSGRYKQETW